MARRGGLGTNLDALIPTSLTVGDKEVGQQNEVDGGGGFADPTLLIGHGEDSKGGGFWHRLFEAAGAYNLLGFT